MLPEWVDTNQFGNCHVLYGGFNPNWAAGRLERRVVDTIAQQLAKKYPNQATAVVVPNWYEFDTVTDWIQQTASTQTIICSLTDPVNTSWQGINNIKLFGYADVKFDFWAVACGKFFKQYQYEELLPTQFDFVFLNYNRKPHSHRVELIHALEQADLVSLGCNTLSGTDYTVGDRDIDYLATGATDVVGDIGIPNDIYSLGRIDIWQRSFVNIVSETQFATDSVFLSEKTFKPIIGLRPFVINGNPKIYTWLRDAGFDCFEDIFPVDQLITSTSTDGSHKLIVESIQSLVKYDLVEFYQQLLPRLRNNQTHFYEYTNRQQDQLHNFENYI